MEYFKQVNDELRPLLPRFFDNLDSDLKELQQALDDDDREEVHRIAHGIKGSAGSFGLEPLRRQASDVEEAAGESHQELEPPVMELIQLAKSMRRELTNR